MGTTKVKFIDDSQKGAKEKKIKKELKKEVFPKETEEKTLSEGQNQPAEEISTQKDEAPKKAEKKNRVKAKKQRGKKYVSSKNLIDKNKIYSLSEAVKLAKDSSYAKFDATLEAHFQVIAPDLRGLLKLPHPIPAKSEKVLIFTSEKIEAGDNILLGNEETIEKIREGKFAPGRDFQKVIATAEFMPKLAKIAKTLGPAGLMPNPKSQTLVDNVEKALKDIAGGQIEYKTDPKTPVIHLGIAKVSQKEDKIEANILAIVSAIGPKKIKGLHLSPTMGPSIKVDPSTLAS